MWLKAQNEMAGLWQHAAMGPVERMVRPRVLAGDRFSLFARWWLPQFDLIALWINHPGEYSVL